MAEGSAPVAGAFPNFDIGASILGAPNTDTFPKAFGTEDRLEKAEVAGAGAGCAKELKGADFEDVAPKNADGVGFAPKLFVSHSVGLGLTGADIPFITAGSTSGSTGQVSPSSVCS